VTDSNSITGRISRGYTCSADTTAPYCTWLCRCIRAWCKDPQSYRMLLLASYTSSSPAYTLDSAIHGAARSSCRTVLYNELRVHTPETYTLQDISVSTGMRVSSSTSTILRIRLLPLNTGGAHCDGVASVADAPAPCPKGCYPAAEPRFVEGGISYSEPALRAGCREGWLEAPAGVSTRPAANASSSVLWDCHCSLARRGSYACGQHTYKKTCKTYA
jgi:hypothetical protein